MSKKHTVEYIKEYVNNRGFILLSEEYSNKNSKLNFSCVKHGNFYCSFDAFRRNKHGCSKCGYESGGKINSLTLEEAKNTFTSHGYNPLFQEYSNAHEPLKALCQEHGEFLINLSNLKNGRKCPSCGLKSKSIKNTLSESEVINRIEEKGCKLLSPYVSYKEDIKVECAKHGIFNATMQNFTYGYGCPKCSKGRSKSQDELANFIKQFYPEVQENSRDIIQPQELDIYIPSLNLAIEYCGLRWHSELYKKDNNYHLNKMLKCKEKGIRLITIFEDEWLERQDQVKNFLKSVLNKNKTNIFARKCAIKPLNSKEAKDFLENNHIQGKAVLRIAIGLYYENELMGIITGNKHHRQGFDNILVLNRLAFKTDVSVSGGSSKLLKTLINYAKSNGYSKIISWSDNRWSEGNVYEKLGFTLTEELKPDYSYVNRDFRESKQSNKKNNLLKKGGTGNTEHEMALSIGLHRIWDCGKKRWEMEVN